MTERHYPTWENDEAGLPVGTVIPPFRHERRAQEVADQLRGTNGSISDFTTQEERDDVDFCAELDTHVFECDSCNWWCDNEELVAGAGDVGEQICTDCVASQ